EGAQKTYASLAQRYPGVIAGRGVDIKQAEIAGKGTFYRVRIPAGTKDAAVNLCTKFKSAGGSCFVTQ
ncbi:SPOR domain-containing protein, partial [Escherichia coli]|nr:SPOR domain-containing protein [Escherichia coli]